MSMPIARAGWWTGAQETLPSPPPPKPEHATAQPVEYFPAFPIIVGTRKLLRTPVRM